MTNMLPGLLVCPRFFHLHRLYFSPWCLNPPPQTCWWPPEGAAPPAPQLDHMLATRSRRPFRGMQIARTHLLPLRPSADHHTIGFIIQFFFTPAAHVQTQIYLPEVTRLLLSCRGATTGIFYVENSVLL